MSAPVFTRKRSFVLLCLFCFFTLFSRLSWAAEERAAENTAEAAIKRTLEARMGRVARVTKTPYLGLYEVFLEGEILYTDENVTVLLGGPLIEYATMTNVTAERLQKLMAIDFSKLPLTLAIKQKRGNGQHVLATFEDPNCSFCKRFAQEVATLDNVTIYTFLFPILSPDSFEKSKKIWCAQDRAKAWNAWMREGKMPEDTRDCDTGAIQKSLEIGRGLLISGVPTLFFSDGQRSSGVMPIEMLRKKLFGPQEAPAAPKTKKTESGKN